MTCTDCLNNNHDERRDTTKDGECDCQCHFTQVETDALFRGCFPTGFSWADRTKEEHGDYKKIAHLSYATLEFTVYDANSPLLAAVRAQARQLQGMRGQLYPHTQTQRIELGHDLKETDEIEYA